ncbi:hypothetical protein GCM10028774_62000 [Spirosoma jeollabukense]
MKWPEMGIRATDGIIRFYDGKRYVEDRSQAQQDSGRIANRTGISYIYENTWTCRHKLANQLRLYRLFKWRMETVSLENRITGLGTSR